MTYTADISQWLLILTFGILAGVIGQAARVVVGLKKAQEDSAQRNEVFAFDGSKFWISMSLGAIAGTLAAIATLPGTTGLTHDMVLGVMAAGYAGSDFIEGALSRFLPSSTPEPSAPKQPAGLAADGAQG